MMLNTVRRPLSARPRDFVYFCFFLIHIPVSLFVDLQALYPPSLVPAALQKLMSFYIKTSGDPLLSGVFGYYTPDYPYVWFRSFLWLEMLFQVPVFFLGVRGLWKDSPSTYLPILIYGASTTTTLLPCLATIWAVPTATTDAAALTAPAVSTAQRVMLLFSYIPFLLVPLAMTIDMAWRLSSPIDFRRHARGDGAARTKREE